MRGFLLALMLCSALAPDARAQATPEAVATRYAEALRQSDFATAARLMHPAALRQLRELFEPMLQGDLFDQVGPALFSVRTKAELARAADTTMYASFLRNATAQQAGLGDALRSSKTTVLGHVAGGADTVFVVARIEMSVEGISVTQFDVLPFARHDGQWRGLLKADFTNMAAMMRKAAAERGRGTR